MNCEDCEPRLVDHALDELTAEHAGPVSRHLAGCSACALAFCRLRADLDGVARVYSESPRPAVADALRARVRARFAPTRWQRAAAALRRPIPVYGAMAAAALPIAVWVGVTVAEPRPSSPPTATHRGPALIDNYDGNDLMRVDPNLL